MMYITIVSTFFHTDIPMHPFYFLLGNCFVCVGFFLCVFVCEACFREAVLISYDPLKSSFEDFLIFVGILTLALKFSRLSAIYEVWMI